MNVFRVGTLLIVIAVLLTSCSLFGGKPKPTYFGEHRTYVNWLASSQEECDQLNDQGINCFQMAEFFADGTAELMLTDSVQRGTYGIFKNTTIEVSIEASDDQPSSFTFTMLDDGSQIRSELDDSIWELEQ